VILANVSGHLWLHSQKSKAQSLIFGGIQRGELSKSAMNLQAEVTSGFLEQLEN